MSLQSMLRTSVTLQRNTPTKVNGVQVKNWADVSGASSVKCDIQPASAKVQALYSGQQERLLVTHTIYLKKDIQAKAGDRLVSGTRYFLLHGYRRTPPGYKAWPAVADVEEQVT